MPAYYDFYQTPQHEGSTEHKKYHARVVVTETITLDDLAGLIHSSSSLTVGDVLGTTTLLIDYLFDSLRNGRRVYIPRLGYFQLTAACPPLESPEGIRAESIKVKGISFRPDHEAKRAIRRTAFVRIPEKRHSKERSPEDIHRQLTVYFASDTHITRRKFQALCGFTQPTAYRRLKELVQQGCLRVEGEYRNSPVYVPAEGYFGR